MHVVLETPKVAHVHLDFSDDAEVIANCSPPRERGSPSLGTCSGLEFDVYNSLVCGQVSVHLEGVINHNTTYAQSMYSNWASAGHTIHGVPTVRLGSGSLGFVCVSVCPGGVVNSQGSDSTDNLQSLSHHRSASEYTLSRFLSFSRSMQEAGCLRSLLETP